jgi:hypothetical protein
MADHIFFPSLIHAINVPVIHNLAIALSFFLGRGSSRWALVMEILDVLLW